MEIRFFEFVKKKERILKFIFLSLLSVFKRNLSAEVNAISIPEKKAEKNIAISI